jgi:hypothetical protein
MFDAKKVKMIRDHEREAQKEPTQGMDSCHGDKEKG